MKKIELLIKLLPRKPHKTKRWVEKTNTISPTGKRTVIIHNAFKII